jgi:hypothetical protein
MINMYHVQQEMLDIFDRKIGGIDWIIMSVARGARHDGSQAIK